MKVEVVPTLVNESIEAVTLLQQLSGLSRSKIKAAMTSGAVWREVNGRSRRLRRASTRLAPGERIAMYYDSDILEIVPEQPRMLEDAGAYSVWVKPPSLMSGGSRFGDHCAVNRIIEKALDRPTSLVHRLDRFVWGIMVLAHTRAAAADLSKQFEQRLVRKTYQAVVHGEFDRAVTIDTPLEGKTAISHVTPLSTDDAFSLVQVSIETGRKHQIREHLASIGHPIVGDRLHGSTAEPGIQLASVELAFVPPGGGATVTFLLEDAQRPRLPAPESQNEVNQDAK